MDTKEPTQEFTPQQHKGWSGYRDIMITAAEKVIDRGIQPVVDLPHSTEALREIQRRRRLLDKKLIWARQAQGVDEIKRRKKELNSIRSEFNAYRWNARREWGNKKVSDLQKAEESHDLGAIYRILRETGLSVEKNLLSQRPGIFVRLKRQPHTWNPRGQDQTENLGNFADRVPEIPTNHKLDWLPDGQEIRSTICQMRDSAPSMDEITRTLIVAGGEDSLDTVVSLIQILWESEYKNWEKNIADIEVCMLNKGKGPRNLPQNQRFIELISFGLRVVDRIVAKRLTSHAENNLLIVKEQYGFRSKHSVLGPVLVLTLRSRSSSILNMILLPVFLQTLPRHTRVFQDQS